MELHTFIAVLVFTLSIRSPSNMYWLYLFSYNYYDVYLSLSRSLLTFRCELRCSLKRNVFFIRSLIDVWSLAERLQMLVTMWLEMKHSSVQCKILLNYFFFFNFIFVANNPSVCVCAYEWAASSLVNIYADQCQVVNWVRNKSNKTHLFLFQNNHSLHLFIFTVFFPQINCFCLSFNLIDWLITLQQYP